MDDKRLYKEVTEEILDLGADPMNKGFRYLREAVMIVYKDRNAINSICKNIYGKIAEDNETTIACVERSIRNCINKMICDNMDRPGYFLMRYMNRRTGTVKNGTAIALISERIALKE